MNKNVSFFVIVMSAKIKGWAISVSQPLRPTYTLFVYIMIQKR